MSFDRLAPHYRWMEWVLAGGKLQRCRTAFLDRVEGTRNALIAGEGNGRFLAEWRRKQPWARATVVDASARMLGAARTRLERQAIESERVQFVHADLRDGAPEGGPFDLIVTHFFLDCFPPGTLRELVERLARAAAPEAAWLIADFQVPAGGPARWRARAIHALMCGFFRLATRLPARCLTPPDAFLKDQGFELQERRTSEWGLLHTDLWKLRSVAEAASEPGRADLGMGAAPGSDPAARLA